MPTDDAHEHTRKHPRSLLPTVPNARLHYDNSDVVNFLGMGQDALVLRTHAGPSPGLQVAISQVRGPWSLPCLAGWRAFFVLKLALAPLRGALPSTNTPTPLPRLVTQAWVFDPNLPFMGEALLAERLPQF